MSLSSEVGGDTIDQILNCSFNIIESSSKGFNALLSGETHGHEFINIGLVGLRLRGGDRSGFESFWLNCWHFLLLLFLFLLLLHLGLFWFDFCLGLRFLREDESTWTCDMTTRKSVSLMPSFSMVSSLTMVFPL